MSLERLRAAKKKTVGSKQTVKAIQRGMAKAVYVARDADAAVTREVITAAQAKNMEVFYVDTMVALGKACAIEVGAATAAILEL